MWWEFAIYIALALGMLYLVVFQTIFLKKYWKYILAVAFLVVIVVRIVAAIASRRPVDGDSVDLQNAVGEIREKIEEANMEAAVRVAAARSKDQARMDELKAVMAIRDKVERRRRLAQMVG